MTKREFLSLFSVASCLVGTVIGAGFASGQEIMTFFVRYGIYGGWAMVLSGVLFALYMYFVLDKIQRENITSFRGYFDFVPWRGLVTFMETVSYLFMGASFCVMVAGSGAVAEEFGGERIFGILFMAVMCFVIFIKGAEGMIKVNSFMTPLIIAGILAVSVMGLYGVSPTFSGRTVRVLADNPVSSAILYVSYNTVTLIGVLIPIRHKLTSGKVVSASALSSGTVLGTMGLILWYLLWRGGEVVSGAEVPMLFLTGVGTNTGIAYGIVLYMAMITTAVSSGYAFVTYLEDKTRLPTPLLSALVCGISVPFSMFGFAELVDKLYKFFGVLGLSVLVLVFCDGIKRKLR